jgi:hypothetical protein
LLGTLHQFNKLRPLSPEGQPDRVGAIRLLVRQPVAQDRVRLAAATRAAERDIVGRALDKTDLLRLWPPVRPDESTRLPSLPVRAP